MNPVKETIPQLFDNTAQSKLVVGIGGHRRKPIDDMPPDNAFNRTQSQMRTIFTPAIKPIQIDPNNLPADCDCPYGCKVDVYVTARHRPGCPHQYRQEFNVGAKKFDYLGKGTYSYLLDGEEPEIPSPAEHHWRCEDFSIRCEKLLRDLSKYNEYRSLGCICTTSYTREKNVLERGRLVKVIDKYSFSSISGQVRCRILFLIRICGGAATIYVDCIKT